MERTQVHYEVFARTKVNAPWSLQAATEDRHRALDTAEQMLTDGTAAAVKVSKETLDPQTGEFQSIDIFSKGAVIATRKQKPPPEADGPLCVAPQDLYTAHARERIGRLLDGWLRRKSATAFELLHRPDLVEALDASGTELQHAIQKISIPDAQARGVATHEVIRSFQKLVERTVERVLKDGRKGHFPTLNPATFAEVAQRLRGEDLERAYLLGAGVAAYLAPSRSWSDKVSRILDLADFLPEGHGSRAFALAVLEQPLSEILASHGGIADLVGPDLDLGGSLAALTRLAAERAVRIVTSHDPGLERLLPPLPAHAERLAKWLEAEEFAMVRAGLSRRILMELRGPRRLRPSDPDGEIALLRALAMALSAAAGKLVGLEDVQEAFIERSKSLVAGDFVDTFLEGRESALSEIQALVRLAENVAGPLNKRAAARWIVGYVTALRFEREMRGGSESPSARLAALASLQRSVLRTGLAEGDTQEITAVIGRVGDWVEADSKLIAMIARSSGPLLQRLTSLLRLASGEAAPRGPAADRARAEALKLLRAPGTRGDLANAPESLTRLKDLLAQAGLAA